MWKVINSLSCIDLIFGFLVGSENIDSEQTSQMNDSARQSEERISQLTSEQADLKQQLEAQVRDNANLSRSVHLSVSLSFHLSDCLFEFAYIHIQMYNIWLHSLCNWWRSLVSDWWRRRRRGSRILRGVCPSWGGRRQTRVSCWRVYRMTRPPWAVPSPRTVTLNNSWWSYRMVLSKWSVAGLSHTAAMISLLMYMLCGIRHPL